MKLLIVSLLVVILTLSACNGVCNHEYVGNTLSDADCISVGTREYVCSKCEHSYTEELPILWHEPNDEGECVRCNVLIEQNLYYKEIPDKEEYCIAGIRYGYTVNDDMIIPTTYEDLPITEIAEEALKGADLKTVNVSPTIRNIREGAFTESLVKTVNCSFGLTGIATDAFKNCYLLREISIHPSLMFIGENAFSGCVSLVTVNFYGTLEQFNKINVMAGNDCFLNATITFINN